jgi:hypothetical protein
MTAPRGAVPPVARQYGPTRCAVPFSPRSGGSGLAGSGRQAQGEATTQLVSSFQAPAESHALEPPSDAM